MKVLVTGGAGFIGSNFISYYLRKHPEDTLICLDKLTYAGNISNLKEVWDSSRFKFYKADIADRTEVDRIFSIERPDVVVNFAAETHVDRSIDDPSVFLNTNIIGTSVLFDASLKYEVFRFHQISTDEVYGDLPLDSVDVAFTEESPIKPSSPYSASKASADMLALAYFRTYGLPVTISRCSNNYGPYQFPEKLIPKMIMNVLYDKPLPIYGKGNNVRDWIHVSDHSRAVDLIIHDERIGEVYNIGSRCEIDNLSLVRLICRIMDKPESLIEFVADRKGHDLRYAIDPYKMERNLGWGHEVDFEEGLQDTVSWYLDNRKWLDDILSGRYIERNSSMMV